MSTKKEPPDKTETLFDQMVPHVRYEVEHVLDFYEQGNTWCSGLPADVSELTFQSLLEAALIHVRCVIEFLGEKPKADQVRARDYLPNDWAWTITDRAAQIDDLHDRVAHLGFARADGEFRWDEWVTEQAPLVLRTFREFLTQLHAKDSRRYALFVDGNDLLTKLDRVTTPD